jgi:hypothetical protein
MSTLDQVGKGRFTDKTSDIHNYCVKYEKYLPLKRYDKMNILEIGVLNGYSLHMWKDYYYLSNVVGIDIDTRCKVHEGGGRVNVEIGSQDDEPFLLSVVEKYGAFDFIVDDGSHMNSHVIKSFEVLFPTMKSGGVYVVEDSCTAYWSDWGGGYLNPNSSVEYFKRLSDDVNFRGLMNFNTSNVHARREDWLTDLSHQTQPDCRTDIESITFLNSIIIIIKR